VATLDISKAFDKVQHDKLLASLNSSGLPFVCGVSLGKLVH
jgi:hypothetical protein